MTPTLRIRTYPDQPLCRAWLIHSLGGGAQSSLMHGTMTVEQADELAAALGVPVEKSEAGIGFADHAVTLADERERQRELFTGASDGRK